MKPRCLLLALGLCVPGWTSAQDSSQPLPPSPAATGIGPTTAITAPAAAVETPPTSVSGLDIYRQFEQGLADPSCAPPVRGGVWRNHFRQAPARLAAPDDDLLPLFGYVVEAVREANLPSEYALIPFVESGYKPGARSSAGPAGLWQFIGLTARNHGVPVSQSYDGRLSPVDSTRAAVRYLKTLHGMFGGDWRLAVMAYNAGEYRVLQSMRKAGMNAQNARPADLPGLSGVTYAYVQKLQALSCLLQTADDQGDWLDRVDRQVPRLVSQPIANTSLAAWASQQDQDAALLGRLNPALVKGVPRLSKPVMVLAPATPDMDAVDASVARVEQAPSGTDEASASTATVAVEPSVARTAGKRSHTVSRGESLWTIARRYGLKPAQLQAINGLNGGSVLRPGMVLALD